MRLIRGVAGALLWIVSAVLALVAVILCVTIILLPVGLPLLGYARRLFTLSLKLMLPRALAHPVDTAAEATRKGTSRVKDEAKETVPLARRKRPWPRRSKRRLTHA